MGEPGAPAPEGGGRLFRALRAVAVALEPSLVLVLAIGVATLLAAPLIPAAGGLAFPLRPEPAAAASRLDDTALVERIEALESAGPAEILLMHGEEHVVVREPRDRDRAERDLERLLPQAGFRATTPTAAVPVDIGALFEGRPTRLAALLSLQAIALLAAGAAMIRWRIRPTIAPSAGATRAVLEGLLAGAAALLANAGIAAGLAAIGLPVEEQAWLQRLFADRGAWLPLVPWLVAIGPVAEELFFRGYVFRFLRQELGGSSALVLSSLLFAAIHTNLSGLPVYLAIGAILAYVYQRTGNLVAPIVAHALLNAVALGAAVAVAGG